MAELLIIAVETLPKLEERRVQILLLLCFDLKVLLKVISGAEIPTDPMRHLAKQQLTRNARLIRL